MKAVIYKRYGSPDVLKLSEVEKPVPQKNQILIKIKASSVNAYDWRHVKADPFMIRFMVGGVFRPKHPILGADMAGIVEATGSEVTRFKPGDEVFGEGRYGGFAEYACVDENSFVLKPENISFEEAAAAPMAALTALQGLRDYGQIQEGYHVLVNGSSGGVGSFAVQLAKYFGAEVTAVCSTSKRDMVRSLGADYVVDYKFEDVTKMHKKIDLIFDVAAFRPVSDYDEVLNPGAIYAMAGGSIYRIMKLMIKENKNRRIVRTDIKREDLEIIKDLLESGKIRSVIDKVYSLEQTSDAVRHVEEGRARGKVVVAAG